MMSRYADGHSLEYKSYSPSTSPRGRRYILQNLNYKKKKQINLDKSRDKEYFDIRKAPPSTGSVASNNSTSKPVGTSNKVMPTDSPRKTPREPPVYVSPRKDIKAVKTPRKESPEKNNTPMKNDKNESGKQTKNELGLTPRDEYMVTKLYDREIIYLKPSEVRYTHDQITAHFQDGRSMISTFIALLYGRAEIRLGGNDVPPIEVMQTDELDGGKSEKIWYVVNGNRRLYVFKRLEKCGALTTMQVVARKYDSIEMDKHFLTRNKGRTVSITNDAAIGAKFVKEVSKWKEWKAKQPAQKPGVKGKSDKGQSNPSKKQPGLPSQTNKSSCCTIS
ncbi:hypothetical protein DPMN_134668 [Dreissena polymorpha]|uniref:Uncharacterized protein n=1 Tax=Dreissena polymorpha TaxID=45954 RepID=A0A9D4FW12_DREPO|nr:hypothetical protein DPMN_134668 [Dreissena polymorpha]